MNTNAAVPANNTRQGGQRRHVLDAVAVQNAASGVYTATTAAVTMSTPSARLQAMLAFGYRPNATQDTTIPATWTVSATGWKRTQSGLLVRVNQVQAATPIPTSIEMNTLLDELRAVITVPNAPGTSVAAGQLYAIGTWEPAPGAEMPDEELAKLFALCRLNVQGIATSTTGA